MRTQAELAVAMGRDRRTIQAWLGRGCPCRVKGGYSIPATHNWAMENIAALPSGHPRAKASPDPSDPLVEEGDETEALERLRLANAKLSELKYERETKALVPAAELNDLMTRAMSLVRQAGDNLGRRYGPEAQLMLNEAIDGAMELINQMERDAGDN